jgi:hypothetical protein
MAKSNEPAPKQLDWDGVPDESIREILRQSEVMMSDMLTASCSVDARATALAGVYAAIAAALMATCAALVVLSKGDDGLIVAFGIWAIGFIAGSLLCVGSAQPRDYFGAGNEPDCLIDAAKTTRWLLTSSLDSLQRKIAHNRTVMGTQGTSLTWAHRAVAIGFALGAVDTYRIHRMMAAMVMTAR